jgi:hypothetical protein
MALPAAAAEDHYRSNPTKRTDAGPSPPLREVAKAYQPLCFNHETAFSRM